MSESGKRVVLWFRNDLRIHDNPFFSHAATRRANLIFPVYIFDPRHYGKQAWHKSCRLPTSVPLMKCNNIRAKFQIESVYNLKKNLQGIQSDLHIFYGKTEEILERICDHDTIILAQEEYGSEEREQQMKVKRWTRGKLELLWGGALLHEEDIPKSCTTGLKGSFTSFRKQIERDYRKINVRKLYSFPKDLPPTSSLSNIEGFAAEPITVDTLGFKPVVKDRRVDFDMIGGEDAALERLKYYVKKRLATYKQTRNGLQGADFSSHLSPWLANGTVSAKQVYWAVKEYEKLNGGMTDDTYWLVFELLWRDYFRFLMLKHGGKMFLEWGPLNRKPRDFQWSRDEDAFKSWIDGNTGERFVDALMRQLKATGFMSNRGRQNVASYLIWNLGLDWRLGAAYFEEQLIDHDVASNYGNWVHAANLLGGRRNVFNCKKQAKDYDPQGTFQRTWLSGGNYNGSKGYSSTGAVQARGYHTNARQNNGRRNNRNNRKRRNQKKYYEQYI